jgi:hypothetical protein
MIAIEGDPDAILLDEGESLLIFLIEYAPSRMTASPIASRTLGLIERREGRAFSPVAVDDGLATVKTGSGARESLRITSS